MLPLGFVVCGAPLAGRADEAAGALVEAGWTLTVGLTSAAADWISADKLTDAAGSGEEVTGRPNRAVAFPLTFNTANKIARGVMDNQVTGTLCDCLGTGAPIVAALFVNDRLWGHPSWATTLDTLARSGVVFLDPHSGRLGEPVPVRSGTGGDVVAAFDPTWVVEAVAALSSGDS